MKNHFSIALCLLVVTGLIGDLSVYANDTPELIIVHIPDANFRAALREALGNPIDPLTDQDLASLSFLDASKRQIRDLTGLEYCTGLISLNLSNNEITVSDPLSGLPMIGFPFLESLSLHNNQITTIVLKNVPNLRELRLYNNLIADMDGIAYLPALESLDLGQNKISVVKDLSGLPNLRRLELRTNQIADLSAIGGLSSLTYLGLGGNQIVGLNGLTDLPNLESLSLYGNQLSTVSLSDLPNLKDLYLSVNQIIRVSLVNLPMLQTLSLSDNRISDLAAITVSNVSLTGLSLNLGSNPIYELHSGISGLQLKSLELGYYFEPISEMSISGLGSLTHLELTQCRINRLNVSSLDNLTHLELSFNRVDELNLSDLPLLEVLNSNGWPFPYPLPDTGHGPVDAPRIGKMSLSSLDSLTYLSLAYNGISELSLSDMPVLQKLYLQGNQITGVGSLLSMSTPSVLWLSDNFISDLQPLLDHPGVGAEDRISIQNNPLNSTAFNGQIPALQAKGAEVQFALYSGLVQLIDQEPPGTWNYELHHMEHDVYGWEYNGSAVTGAHVDGEAQAAGWRVVTQTDTRVLFATDSPLRSGVLTGFHIVGSTSGTGTYDVGVVKSEIEGPNVGGGLLCDGEADQQIVPGDEIEIKVTLRPDSPGQWGKEINLSLACDLFEEPVSEHKVTEASDGTFITSISVRIANEDVTVNHPIAEVIAGTSSISFADRIEVCVEYSGQSWTTVQSLVDADGEVWELTYPDFSSITGAPNPDFGYYRSGDKGLSNTTDTLVRKYAIAAARYESDKGEFPDVPSKIIHSVYRYTDYLLEPDGYPADYYNDIDILKSYEQGTLKTRKHPCIEHAYLFTSFTRTLGFYSREINVALGPVINFFFGWYWILGQEAAAEVWYGDKWYHYDPFMKVLDREEYGTYYAAYGSTSEQERHWNIYHSLPVSPHPAWDVTQWEDLEYGSKRGGIIQAHSPVTLLYTDNTGRRIGTIGALTSDDYPTKDTPTVLARSGTINEIPGAWYIPPGLSSYADQSIPDSASIIDETI